MEATGHYWVSLYFYLIELGFTVYVINPIQSDAFGEFSSTSLADEDIIALRQLSRYRLALVDKCSDWKRKCIVLLDQVFPEYSKLFSDTFKATSRELLSKYPTPNNMLSVDTHTPTELLYKASRGRFGIFKANEVQ